MMPTARKNHVSLDATPYYHCIGRCVRRAFLWGEDPISGQDFSHRKRWVTERLAELSRSFAVNICAYAVMSNHYHLVLHLDAAQARSWSEAEVAYRWELLFSLPLLVQKYLKDELTIKAEIRVAQMVLAQLRHRLCDLSWYMRCLNEPIARRANEEDRCTGRFWEGRFKSQPILDEAGLLACCAYVDLNPVRAGMAATPEAADYTAIQQRLREVAAQQPANTTAKSSVHDQAAAVAVEVVPPLHPFANHLGADPALGLPFSLLDYVELVDWTARIVRTDNKAAMSADTPPILARLGFTTKTFEVFMKTQAMTRGTAIGQVERLKAYAISLKKRCVMGVRMPALARGI
jgi:REP element-mobilizing transposase RayT